MYTRFADICEGMKVGNTFFLQNSQPALVNDEVTFTPYHLIFSYLYYYKELIVRFCDVCFLVSGTFLS